MNSEGRYKVGVTNEVACWCKFEVDFFLCTGHKVNNKNQNV